MPKYFKVINQHGKLLYNTLYLPTLINITTILKDKKTGSFMKRKSAKYQRQLNVSLSISTFSVDSLAV